MYPTHYRFFRNDKERLEHKTQIFHTKQLIQKGNPKVTYKKNAILTTGSRNECDQLVESKIENVKKAGIFVIRRHHDLEVL